MKSRCLNPTNPAYANYGGRGISISPLWINDFGRFLADVGPRPSPMHSIDRINNDGNYEPGNVRWATDVEQARNQRKTKFVEVDGAVVPRSSLLPRTALDRDTVMTRIARGWSIERALTKEPQRYGGAIEFRGEKMNATQWGKRLGIPARVMQQRFRQWSVEDAITTPWPSKKRVRRHAPSCTIE